MLKEHPHEFGMGEKKTEKPTVESKSQLKKVEQDVHSFTCCLFLFSSQISTHTDSYNFRLVFSLSKLLCIEHL